MRSEKGEDNSYAPDMGELGGQHAVEDLSRVAFLAALRQPQFVIVLSRVRQRAHLTLHISLVPRLSRSEALRHI